MHEYSAVISYQSESVKHFLGGPELSQFLIRLINQHGTQEQRWEKIVCAMGEIYRFFLFTFLFCVMFSKK